jgi:hypothetical protein
MVLKNGAGAVFAFMLIAFLPTVTPHPAVSQKSFDAYQTLKRFAFMNGWNPLFLLSETFIAYE